MMKSTGEKPLFAYLKDEECVSINGGGSKLIVSVAPGQSEDILLPTTISGDLFQQIADDLNKKLHGNSSSPHPSQSTNQSNSPSETDFMLLFG